MRTIYHSYFKKLYLSAYSLLKDAQFCEVYPGRTPIALPKNGLRRRYPIIIYNADISNDELEKLYQQ